MPATSLRFANRTTRIPGAYTNVDASALEGPGTGSTGRVLLIGEADGGAPYSAVTPETVLRVRSASALRAALRGGDLREAAAIAFNPANDPNIAGAEEIVLLKVRPDTRASATLSNGAGASLTVRSRDFGRHTNQINVSVAAGTTAGRRVSVAFEGVSESRDNIGGVSMLDLQYREPTGLGWDGMTIAVLVSGIRASGSRAEAGRAGDLASAAGAQAVRVTSSSAGDVGQVATVYALVGGVPTAIPLVLNGTAQVASTAVIDAASVFGVVLSAACVGTVTVSQATGPITLFTIAPGGLSSGGARASGMYLAGALTMVADAATTAVVLIAGRNAAGAVVLESRALAGTTPVVSATTTWSQIDFIGLANVASARTVTFTGTAAETTHTAQATLVAARDYFNALQVLDGSDVRGFTATIATTRTTFPTASLDVAGAASAYYPTTLGLRADLALIVEFLNETALVTGEIASGAAGPPSNTATPVYLSGAADGTTLFADWQAALDLARDIPCDTIVTLTEDPAVHAALGEHLDYRAGAGKSEADGVVGIRNAALSGLASLTEVRAQIAALNNRNIGVVAQTVDRFNAAGVRTTMGPRFLAAMVAGAQAGIALGRSLTHATMDVLAFGQHTSWNPRDNAEELIEAGLVFLERNGSTTRIVRDVTSAVGSDNPVFTDRAANRVINFCTRELRTDLEGFIAEPGNARTATGIKGRAKQRLGEFTNELGILREWRDLTVSIESDRAPVSVAMSPALAINFIPITINLYDAIVTAA
jgi:hypothetical protein